MTFPDTGYRDVAAYCDAYYERLTAATASVDRQRLKAAARMLDLAFKRGARIYVCGNGGSAAIADSFVCDLGKLVQTDTTVVVRIVSLSANVPMMTALANDASYDEVFVYQLRSLAKRGDVLITVSASGDSENVVRAAQWARDSSVHVIALTGFDGGRTAEIAEVNLHVEADNYGVVEDTHQSLMHILGQYLRMAHMPKDLVAERRF